eukprot:4834124-Pleurochrysis_carterae.AAC.3
MARHNIPSSPRHIRYVRAARLCGAVQEGANQGLVLSENIRRWRAVGLGRDRRLDELVEVVRGGRVRAVDGRWDAVGQKGFHHVLYVTGLRERDKLVVTLYLDVEEIRDRALVFYVPACGKGIRKLGVKRARRVIPMEYEQEVDVASEIQLLLRGRAAHG